jgi:hypothetical protein
VGKGGDEHKSHAKPNSFWLRSPEGQKEKGLLTLSVGIGTCSESLSRGLLFVRRASLRERHTWVPSVRSLHGFSVAVGEPRIGKSSPPPRQLFLDQTGPEQRLSGPGQDRLRLENDRLCSENGRLAAVSLRVAALEAQLVNIYHKAMPILSLPNTFKR